MDTGTAGAAVVTGMGAVTPLGAGAGLLYKRWCAGDSGLADGAGRCTGFNPGEYLSRRELRTTDRFTQLSVAAADEALTQAGWSRGDLPYPSGRIGCVIASSMGGLYSLFRNFERYQVSPQRMSPFTVVMYMPNAAAAMIAARWGLRGESCAVVAACASGTFALGTARRMLAEDCVDAVVVGGADAAVMDEVLQAFTVMGALSPSGVPRPFDRARDGFVLGEGAGALVLERGDAAAGRGAAVLGEVIGFGASTDAHDMSAPDPTGAAAAAAISRALHSASVTPADLSYVNAHGTGSHHNDAAETQALKTALGEHAYRVPVSSTKSAIGHLMGGAGTVEAIATLLALSEGVAPPTLGLADPDDGLDLDYVPGTARPMPERLGRGRVAISNSFGLGGNNAVVALRGA